MRLIVILVALVLGVLSTLLLANRVTTPQPTQSFQMGSLLLEEPFDNPYAWEQYENIAYGMEIGARDAAYHMRIDHEGFIWGLNVATHENVVIDVESEQLSDHANNAYGVMCRADPDNSGDGYYFLISGDGLWAIRRISGGSDRALVPFTRSGAIRTGRARNQLRAVCLDDYLALYINGEFAGETRDALFSRGFAGLVASVAGDHRAEITFDNLEIHAGTLGW
jgi:hypothetical protein